ncbi:hypothetical protein PGTUg99_033088 [Puccinia graminis f. sp. tritici]|uniref:Uncharacterized protein n=1 Tax=Puccinia graminis f. sp. tritici TaxID=56615 RepID=A0A5B0SLW8_PUCGR|nr:hypothetical protein PGTUg99_033088 [Puccinia graminis f. sp. tritici]
MDADELEESTRLELSFLSQNAPSGSAEYSKSSIEGALRFSQAPWAPFDDPQHLRWTRYMYLVHRKAFLPMDEVRVPPSEGFPSAGLYTARREGFLPAV